MMILSIVKKSLHFLRIKLFSTKRSYLLHCKCGTLSLLIPAITDKPLTLELGHEKAQRRLL